MCKTSFRHPNSLEYSIQTKHKEKQKKTEDLKKLNLSELKLKSGDTWWKNLKSHKLKTWKRWICQKPRKILSEFSSSEPLILGIGSKLKSCKRSWKKNLRGCQVFDLARYLYTSEARKVRKNCHMPYAFLKLFQYNYKLYANNSIYNSSYMHMTLSMLNILPYMRFSQLILTNLQLKRCKSKLFKKGS